MSDEPDIAARLCEAARLARTNAAAREAAGLSPIRSVVSPDLADEAAAEIEAAHRSLSALGAVVAVGEETLTLAGRIERRDRDHSDRWLLWLECFRDSLMARGVEMDVIARAVEWADHVISK